MDNEKLMLDLCMDLANATVQKGSLFVIDLGSRSRSDYYTGPFGSIKRNGVPLSILSPKDRVLIKQLAELDGAVIVDRKGHIRTIGATLKHHKDFSGHGKRHAFALGTSRIKDIVCILASEEDSHIRAFRDGVCIADIDASTKMPVGVKQRLIELLTTPVSATLISAGIATSVLTLNPIPAIITIAGSNVIVYSGFEKLKKFFQRK